MKQENESQVCVCGHPLRKHRRNGKCSKCGCKRYGEQAHPPECRCEPCAWNRILALEETTRMLDKEVDNIGSHIDERLQPMINKHEGFLGEVFKLTPQDLLDLEAFRDTEEQRKVDQEEQNEKDKKKIEQAMEKQVVDMGYKEKPVQPKPKAPTTPS